ncbi:MAG: 2-phospho-L-lactate guanylyltransferase [Haloferacaceae archaeon]
MRFLVPYAADRPKTRLSPALDDDERAAFAAAMRRDVVSAVRAAGHDAAVLSTAPLDSADAPVAVDDRPLSAAVNAALDGSTPLGVLAADLALVTPAAVSRLADAEGDVVIAPGRGGGTNALVVRHPDFRVDFHGASYLDHRAAARQVDAAVTEVDSMRLATDVDDPPDLVEVLLHGTGEARKWLVDAGFALDVGDGRVGVRRET